MAHDWVEEIGMAVTVTDAGGRILSLNRAAQEVFAADGGAELVGRDVFDCHPEPSGSQLRAMFDAERPHHYTIASKGQRRMIHQLPWYSDGAFAGFVELSIPIGEELPHRDRG